MEQVPSNSNLNEIITQTIANIEEINTGYEKIIVGINKSIDKIVSIKINTQAINKLNRINDLVRTYISMLGNAIDSLVNGDSKFAKSGRNIQDLLGYIEEKRIGDEKVNEKYVLINGLIAFSGVFKNISKLLEEVADADYGKNFLKTKMNIKLFINNSKDLVKYMMNQLQEISNLEIGDLLGNDSVVERIKEKTEAIDKNKASSRETEKITTKTHGVLDAIEKYLTLAKIIYDLKIPNPVRTKIQIILFNSSLHTILRSLKKLASVYGNKEYMRSIIYLSSTFERIDELVDHFQDTLESINNLSIKIISRLIPTKIGLKALYDERNGQKFGIIYQLNKVILSNELKQIAEFDVKIIDKFGENADQFINIVINLSEIGKIKYISRLLGTIISLDILIVAMGRLQLLNNNIANLKIDNKKLSKLERTTIILKGVASNLGIIFSLMVLMAPVAVLAAIAALGISLGLLGLKLIVITLKLISIDAKDINTVTKLTLMLLALSVMCIAIVAISVIAQNINWMMIGKFFLALLAITITIVAIGWLITAASPIIAPATIGIGLLNIMMLAVLLLAGQLLLLQLIELDKTTIENNAEIIINTALSIVDKIFNASVNSIWKKQNNDTFGGVIGNFFRSIIGGSAVLIEILFSIGILAATFVSVLIILFIAVGLEILQEINLNSTAIENNVEIVINTARNIIGHIYTNKKQNEDDFSNNINDGNKDSVKTIAFKFLGRFIDGLNEIIEFALAIPILLETMVSIAIIWGIAALLNKIQTIDINEKAITDKITDIITCVENIKNQVLGKEKSTNFSDNTSNGNENSTIKNIIGAFGDFATSIISIIDSLLVIGLLATTLVTVSIVWGIAALLNKIQKIDINKKAITDKITDIITCVDTIKEAVFDGDNVNENSKQKGLKEKLLDLGRHAISGVVDVIDNAISGTILYSAKKSVEQFEAIVNVLYKVEKLPINTKLIQDRSDSIITLVNYVSEQVVEKNNINTISSKKVKSFGNYVDDSVKLMKNINKLDDSKLLKYTDMWKTMTEFMNTIKNLDISELSDAIVNKIAPAMSDISDNVDKMGQKNDVNNTASIAINPQQTASNVPNITKPSQTIIDREINKNNIDYSSYLDNIVEWLYKITNNTNKET